jgi:hypothetical protein
MSIILVIDDVIINTEMFLVTDFINLKINLIQSFICVWISTNVYSIYQHEKIRRTVWAETFF